MDSLRHLLDGFAIALGVSNLLWAFAGVVLGTIVGVLPGIGPALTVALLLPVTFRVDPVSAFIMFAGIYSGAMYVHPDEHSWRKRQHDHRPRRL
jgi:putative tricarboxylic transport membrane protein